MTITRFVSVVVLSLVALFVGSSPAQDVIQNAGPLVHPITRKQVDRYITIMSADADQRTLALTLYKGYREAFHQAVTDADKTIHAGADKKPEGGRGGNAAMFETVTKFTEDANKLETSFFEDFKATLRPEQAAKFIRVERARRRDVGTRFSIAAGEGLDLVAIADSLKIERKDSLAEAFEEYESKQDRLMVSKAQLFDGMLKTIAKAEMEGKEPDMEMIGKVIKDLIDHSLKVRDSNRDNARSIGALLADEQRAAWEKEIRDRSYPRVYGPSHLSKCFDAIAKVPGLSDDNRTQLASIKESYTHDVAPINDKWAAAIDEKQAKLSEKGMAMMMEMGMMAPDDPLVQARKARREMDQKTQVRVVALLSESQQDVLPKKDPKDDLSDEGAMRDVLPIEDAMEDGGFKEFTDEDKE